MIIKTSEVDQKERNSYCLSGDIATKMNAQTQDI